MPQNQLLFQQLSVSLPSNNKQDNQTDGQREDTIRMYSLRTGLAQMGGKMPVVRTMEYLCRAGGA